MKAGVEKERREGRAASSHTHLDLFAIRQLKRAVQLGPRRAPAPACAVCERLASSPAARGRERRNPRRL